jgi:hypothetical protein
VVEEFTIEDDTEVSVDNCSDWNKTLILDDISDGTMQAVEVKAGGCDKTDHIKLSKPAKLVFEGGGVVSMGQTIEELTPIAIVKNQGECKKKIES